MKEKINEGVLRREGEEGAQTNKTDVKRARESDKVEKG